MFKNSIILKTIALVFFFGSIIWLVLYRSGYYKNKNEAKNSDEKSTIINKQLPIMGGSKKEAIFNSNDINVKKQPENQNYYFYNSESIYDIDYFINKKEYAKKKSKTSKDFHMYTSKSGVVFDDIPITDQDDKQNSFQKIDTSQLMFGSKSAPAFEETPKKPEKPKKTNEPKK